MINNIESIKEIYGRVVYSHAIQEQAVQRLMKKIKFFKVTQVTLLSITSVGVVSAFSDALNPILKHNPNLNIVINTITLIITLLATGLSIYDFSSSNDDDLNAHKTASFQLLVLRDKLLLLLIDQKDGLLGDVAIIQQRDELISKLNDVYENAPKTIYTDFKKARKALKDTEDYTFDPGEIERLLPHTLRNSQ
ncbi:SLATT domain-containing protein [Peribacillus kribbensis]|uniref:SLATT domain-containing protein n=1 Tax=Peribacillus kribbensis TaxID=356658 RepID=UPI0003FF3B2F|nr:SLATT domain-containing protein [Peribacillus kribbensis]